MLRRFEDTILTANTASFSDGADPSRCSRHSVLAYPVCGPVDRPVAQTCYGRPADDRMTGCGAAGH